MVDAAGAPAALGVDVTATAGRVRNRLAGLDPVAINAGLRTDAPTTLTVETHRFQHTEAPAIALEYAD